MIAFDSEGNEVHGLHVCKANTCLHDDDAGLWVRMKDRDTGDRRAWVDAWGGSGPRGVVFTKAPPSVLNLRITDAGEVLDDSSTMSEDEFDSTFYGFIESLPPYAHACDARAAEHWSSVSCRGLVLDAETGLIECCDECARFDSDLEAVAYLQGVLRMKQSGVWE